MQAKDKGYLGLWILLENNCKIFACICWLFQEASLHITAEFGGHSITYIPSYTYHQISFVRIIKSCQGVENVWELMDDSVPEKV